MIQQLLLVLVFTAVTLEWSAVLLLRLDPIFGMLPFIEPVSVPTVVLATFDKFSLSLDGILDSEKMMGCCQILRNRTLHHVRKHCLFVCLGTRPFDDTHFKITSIINIRF